MRFYIQPIGISEKLQGYDLIEDQRHVLSSILDIAKEEKVEAIVIAGDLYDRSVPAVDAVELYNELMVDWNLKEKIPILLYQEITIAVRDFQRVRHGSVIRTIFANTASRSI